MRKKKILPLIISALIVLAYFIVDPVGENRADNDDISEQTQEDQQNGSNINDTDIADEGSPGDTLYDVIRVVDGDTIIIDHNGIDERVRLIGIDTPESVHPDENRNTDYGIIASDFTKSQLSGKKVALEFDVEERDKYDRLLAYVYLDGIMFNGVLVRQGYAMAYTYPPNVKYADYFVELQQKAREEDLGLWKEFLDEGKYLASLKGDKYHLADCSGGQTIKEENRIWFDSAEEAEGMGYSPCTQCL